MANPEACDNKGHRQKHLFAADAGSAAAFTGRPVNEEAGVVHQNRALGVWHEVFVDGSRGEHENLLMLR